MAQHVPSERSETDERVSGPSTLDVSRRTFLAGTAIAGAALGLRPAAAQNVAEQENPAELVNLKLRVNGVTRSLRLEPRVSLLDALREHLGLTGTKKGCNQGACGACTVHVNGARINSCLALAIMHQQDDITTIEGLAQGEALHPMQQAFIDHEGLQCGYCTPGQIMSGVACVREGHAQSDAQTREWMSGNVCRCGCYNGIVEAVRSVREAQG